MDRPYQHGDDATSSRRRALAFAVGAVAVGRAAPAHASDPPQLDAPNVWTQKQTFAQGLEVSPTRQIVLTASSPGGGISRLIELRMSTTYDRPWISWFDEAGRHRASVGYHTTDAAEGGVHQAFELKTAADEAGPNPNDMRTRLSIGTNAQRVQVGFNYCDAVEVNQGESAPGQQFGLFLRTTPRDTTGVPNAIIGVFSAQLDANDNAFGFLDIKPPYRSGGVVVSGNRTATLNIFRNTDTASPASPQIAVKKGDGTNTNAWLFTAKTGLFELPLALSGATGIRLGGDPLVTLYRSAPATLQTDGALVVGGAVGFNGAPPASKPTVTGSRGRNAALTALLKALASTGLITDGTSA